MVVFSTESPLARWRVVIVELLLSLGESLDADRERRQFLRAVMTRISPLASAFVWDKPEASFLAIPQRYPWKALWEEIKKAHSEELKAPKGWVRCLCDKGDVAHIWRLRDSEYFLIIAAQTESYPDVAMHELTRLFKRLATLLDACDQHREVADLAARKRIHDRLFALTPDAIVVTDAYQRILDVNPAFERITGYRRDEVFGQSPKLLASGKHDSRFYEQMWRSLTEQGFWSGEIWNRKKDGTIYPELLTIVAVPDDSGQLQGYVATFTEITEQKKREEELFQLQKELKRSNDYLQAILDHLGEGIYTLDEKGRCTFFNAAAEGILGWKSEEVVGQKLHSLIHHHTADGRFIPESECPIRKAFLDHQVYRSDEETFWHKDGRAIPVRVVAAPLLRNNRIVASVAVFDDISKQKALEAELRRAKEEAERVARMKSEFLSVMSHEIRTPLNGVIGAIDLLLATPLDSEQEDYAKTIRASAETLLTVINDILDFSKLEAGAVTLELIPVALDELVRSVLEIARPLVKNKPVELRLDLPEALPTVLTDAVRLRQVLLNLTSNACKFTTEGSVTLAVDVIERAKEQITLAFEVKDTGIGMTPEVQARLFRPFEQGDASVTRRFGGTGLGLAIVKRIVDLMGGTIEVESSPGKGSTFRIVAPFAYQPIPQPLQAQALAAAALQPAVVLDQALLGLEVLLVEDNPVNQRVAARMLEKLGLTVQIASNGREALERYAEHRPLLIFMDCQMPVMDGFAATAELRARYGDQRPPVIVALTANASEEDRQRCLASGMDDYLAKPVTTSNLEVVLQRWKDLLSKARNKPQLQTELHHRAQQQKQETPSSSDPIFDEQRLAELFGDDQELLVEILSLFVESSNRALARLGVALAHDPPNWEAIPAIAHELQGAAANIGAQGFVAAAKALSQAAKQQEKSELLRLRTLLGDMLHEISKRCS